VKYAIALAVLLALTVIQPSVQATTRQLGFAPNLVLVFLLSWAFIRGSNEAVWVTAIGGLTLGLFSSAPLGLALLGLLPIVPFAVLRELRLLESNFLLAIPVLVVTTSLYFGIMLMGLSFAGEAMPLSLAIRSLVVPGLLGNLLLFAPIYAITLAVGRPPRTAGTMWGNSWRG
jgi:rod shape-determining protein MreD